MENQKWLTTTAGVQMPPLIYGTAWKKERTADLVVKAAKAGFRGIDTACQPRHYKEPLVGEALKQLNGFGIKRESLFLQTKFTPLRGQDPLDVPYDKNSPVELQVAQSFAASQKNLQTSYVDSLVLHSPLAPHELLMKAWKAMESIHLSGGARQLGISNCYSLEVLMTLYDEAKFKPAVIQNRFYGETGYDADLRHWCDQKGIIYQSFWTLTANPHVLESDTFYRFVRKYKKTAAQVFFRYLNQVGIVPLTGTASEEHMNDDLNIFDFELSGEEIKAVTLLLNTI